MMYTKIWSAPIDVNFLCNHIFEIPISSIKHLIVKIMSYLKWYISKKYSNDFRIEFNFLNEFFFNIIKFGQVVTFFYLSNWCKQIFTCMIDCSYSITNISFSHRNNGACGFRHPKIRQSKWKLMAINLQMITTVRDNSVQFSV